MSKDEYAIMRTVAATMVTAARAGWNSPGMLSIYPVTSMRKLIHMSRLKRVDLAVYSKA
jgi:hypothetical protein